jgi:hypothetical protein
VTKEEGTAGESEVKGVWFVALRHYLLDHQGPDRFAEVLSAMPEAHREALENPLTSSWYAEAALSAALRAVETAVARGKERLFVNLIEEATEKAIARFFRVLLRVTSPQFVLNQVPTLWRQVRRGRGQVAVTAEHNVVTIRYTDFPYFDDRRYQLLTEGTLRALVRVAAKRNVVVRIADHGSDWLTARITLGE